MARPLTEPAALGGEDIGSAPSAVRLVAVSDAEPIERRMTTPFVGRAAELDALLAAAERPRMPRPGS